MGQATGTTGADRPARGGHGLLRRDRLQATLDRALRGGAALVVAPGGAGKTSLARVWAEDAPVPVAWHGAGGADRDPRRLVDGLRAALDRAGIPGDSPGDGPGGDPMADLGALLAGLPRRPAALVLDDLHHLEGSGEAEALVGMLLAGRPPGLGLVLLSRAVPEAGFGGALARDTVAGLGGADLAFDETEARALLEAHGLGGDEGALLAGRAGGWAAGILLMARAPTHGLRLSRARKGAQLDALSGEILAGLPPALAAFLEESAALGSASAADTDLLTRRHDSEARYEEAMERGLFLQETGGVYRYHDLFRDWLVGRLRARDPGRLSTLARAAATATADAGDVPAALGALATAGEWPALAAMLDLHKRALFARGHHETMIRHVAGLPPGEVTPVLLVIAGTAHGARGEFKESLTLAAAALAASGGDPLTATRAARLRLSSLSCMGRFQEVATEAGPALAATEEAGLEAHAVSLRELLAVAQARTGDSAAGLATLRAGLKAAMETGDGMDRGRQLFDLATMLHDTGTPEEAEACLAQAATAEATIGSRKLDGLLASVGAGCLAQRGQGETAIARAREALGMAREWGIPGDVCDILSLVADLETEWGAEAAAREALTEATGMVPRLEWAAVGDAVGRAELRLAIRTGDGAGGRAILTGARARVSGPVESALLEVLGGALALRTGAHGEARAALAAAETALARMGRPQEAARALLLLAEACLAGGARTAAEGHLNRLGALARGAEFEGYLLPLAGQARRCTGARADLRHLTSPARALLDDLAGHTGPAGASAPRPRGRGKDAGKAAVPGAWPVLRLSPFGEGRAWLGGEPLDLATLPPRARELLFLAGREPGIPLGRDRLLGLVWDGEKEGEAGLWDAGRNLRRVLGQGRWIAGPGGYRLAGPLEGDEAAFLAAAARAAGRGTAAARLEAANRALALAGTGGYLEWCGSAWTEERRAACMRALVGAAGVAAALHAAAGRGEAALAAARVAATTDPGDEGTCRALCAILQGLGRPGEARAARAAYLLLAGAAGGGD